MVYLSFQTDFFNSCPSIQSMESNDFTNYWMNCCGHAYKFLDERVPNIAYLSHAQFWRVRKVLGVRFINHG